LRSRGAHDNRRSALGGEHHHSHDALRVHLKIVAHDGDIALEFSRRLHDLGGRARMYAQLVDDFCFALWHQVRTE
jgi:hypothetical protein